MKLLLLSAADLRAALPMPAAIAAMRAAYTAVSTGQADVPQRTALAVPAVEGTALFMPAHLPGVGLGAKIVSVFPRNAALGRPVIHGLVVVLDLETGEPLALCEGGFLTAWRTGAGSGAATELLAQPEAAIGAVLGSGAQARTQALAIDAVRDLKTIRVYARTAARVAAFVQEMQPQLRARLEAAGSAAEAVEGADVICAATTSATPVFAGALLKPGAHVNGVGSYTLQMQEVDAETVMKAKIFIDSRTAVLAEAGDLVIPMRAGQTRAEDWTELGEVAAGLRPGRQSEQDVTFFKSVGVAAQDVAAASLALAEGGQDGAGATGGILVSDLPASADVVVVGGGVMGASTAYHLVKAGVRNVVLLEREAFFGLGATGRCAGGIRHQFGTEINIRLSLHSLRMLDELEAETGQPALVRKCGYLFVLTRPEDVAAFQQNVALQHALGVPTEWLSGDEVRQRLPQCVFPDALGGTYLAADGTADPNSVVMAYINASRRLGARCLTDVSVTGLETSGGRIMAVQTSAGRIAAGAVVNAAGPWSAPLARMAGVDLPVQPLRRQWLTTTGLPTLAPGFPFVIDFAQSLYFHPEGKGLLTGMSNAGEPTGFDQSVDPDWELVHLEAAAARLPLLEQAGVASRWAGLYEVTPDAHPILGATPVGGFYVVTGFSGHGFMHGPICGLLMAELLTAGQTRTLDISSLALSRFAGDKTTAEYNVV